MRTIKIILAIVILNSFFVFKSFCKETMSFKFSKGLIDNVILKDSLIIEIGKLIPLPLKKTCTDNDSLIKLRFKYSLIDFDQQITCEDYTTKYFNCLTIKSGNENNTGKISLDILDFITANEFIKNKSISISDLQITQTNVDSTHYPKTISCDFITMIKNSQNLKNKLFTQSLEAGLNPDTIVIETNKHVSISNYLELLKKNKLFEAADSINLIHELCGRNSIPEVYSNVEKINNENADDYISRQRMIIKDSLIEALDSFLIKYDIPKKVSTEVSKNISFFNLSSSLNLNYHIMKLNSEFHNYKGLNIETTSIPHKNFKSQTILKNDLYLLSLNGFEMHTCLGRNFYLRNFSFLKIPQDFIIDYLSAGFVFDGHILKFKEGNMEKSNLGTLGLYLDLYSDFNTNRTFSLGYSFLYGASNSFMEHKITYDDKIENLNITKHRIDIKLTTKVFTFAIDTQFNNSYNYSINDSKKNWWSLNISAFVRFWNITKRSNNN